MRFQSKSPIHTNRVGGGGGGGGGTRFAGEAGVGFAVEVAADVEGVEGAVGVSPFEVGAEVSVKVPFAAVDSGFVAVLVLDRVDVAGVDAAGLLWVGVAVGVTAVAGVLLIGSSKWALSPLRAACAMALATGLLAAGSFCASV